MKSSFITIFSNRFLNRFLPGLVRGFTPHSLLIIFTLLIAACQSYPPNQENDDRFQPVSPAQSYDEQPAPINDHSNNAARPRLLDELTVVFHKSNLQLDPRLSYMSTEAQIFTAIYEGLFTYHPLTMAPVPAAASSWDLSEDRREWTFHIRENARFENGDPLRAQDFRATWLSLLEPEREAPYSSLFDIIVGAREFRMGNASAEDVGIIAVNDKTLLVRLNAPAAFFPSMLCHHSFSPIHSSVLEASSQAASREGGTIRPVSNGPFIIEEINEDRIVFVKNPYYWDAPRVALNRLNIILSDDDGDATALWNSGEARWVNANIDFNALTDHSGIEINAMFATHYYYIRSVREPWNDYRVRRALSLVLPWAEMRENHMLPASTLIFPMSGYPEILGLQENNIEEAIALMAEAGYPMGNGLPELIIRITPSQDASHVAYLMARAWHTILGVNVRIDVVSFRDYYDSLKQDDHDVASITWIGDFADPFSFLQMWTRDSNLNDAGHYDEEFEELIARSMNEEGIQRWGTLAEAEELLLERGNILPISRHPAFNLVSMDELDGWYPNVLDIHPFKYISIRTRRALPGIVQGSPSLPGS